ncbi:MAG: hypothetical protein AAFP86_12095, partial [Planctomycetota bacterium]
MQYAGSGLAKCTGRADDRDPHSARRTEAQQDGTMGWLGIGIQHYFRRRRPTRVGARQELDPGPDPGCVGGGLELQLSFEPDEAGRLFRPLGSENALVVALTAGPGDELHVDTADGTVADLFYDLDLQRPLPARQALVQDELDLDFTVQGEREPGARSVECTSVRQIDDCREGGRRASVRPGRGLELEDGTELRVQLHDAELTARSRGRAACVGEDRAGETGGLHGDSNGHPWDRCAVRVDHSNHERAVPL